jgi:hypothetical protein
MVTMPASTSGAPLTAHPRDLAGAHARRRGEVVRLPPLYPVRLALVVEAWGGATRQRLIARGVVRPTRSVCDAEGEP